MIDDDPIDERSDRQALQRVGRQVRYSTQLMPWMLAYAEWLMLECLDPPKVSLRTQRARGFARAPVSNSHLKLLENREDFRAYCRALQSGPLERARAKFHTAFPTYIDAHAKALGLAVEAGDYNAMAKIAEPVLDRVSPKKVENMAATQVNIVLTPQQVEGVRTYVAPPILVEAEPTVNVSDTDA